MTVQSADSELCSENHVTSSTDPFPNSTDLQNPIFEHDDSSQQFDMTPRGIFLELCAGSATLSSEVKKLGIQVIAVDHEANRHATKCKVMCLDLSLPSSYEKLISILDQCDVIAVHMAPPCGTCSKARGIPMKDGSDGPPPLRSDEFLLGLPGLGWRDQVRVDSSNALYEQMETLEDRNIPWCVENPTNSFLWDLPYFSHAMAMGTKYNCHACAFGGRRKKLTSFLSNRDGFAAMCKFCEDVPPHDHEEWGYDVQNKCFNASKEVEYPVEMCRQYANIVNTLANTDVHPAVPARMTPGTQPKGRSSPQLIPEFLCVEKVAVEQLPAVDHKRCLCHDLGNIPSGSNCCVLKQTGGILARSCA